MIAFHQADRSEAHVSIGKSRVECRSRGEVLARSGIVVAAEVGQTSIVISLWILWLQADRRGEFLDGFAESSQPAEHHAQCQTGLVVVAVDREGTIQVAQRGLVLGERVTEQPSTPSQGLGALRRYP